MNSDLLERAKAMVSEAVARSQADGGGAITALHLTIYPSSDHPPAAVRAAIDAARRGTPAERAQLHFTQAPARYICWNCCGLRFEGRAGVCPNCGGEALLVPEEIVFALDRVETRKD